MSVIVTIFVIPRFPDSEDLLLYKDQSTERRSFGSYVPPYETFQGTLPTDLKTIGFTILDTYGIRGMLKDADVRNKDPYEIFLLADVGSYRSPLLRKFSPYQIENSEENHIASWVPDVVKRLTEQTR